MLRHAGRSLRDVSAAAAIVARRAVRRNWRRPRFRRVVLAAGIVVVIVGAAVGGMSWRLSQGPISLDLATPWLVEAIQEKLGGQQRVEVGGTQIERTEQGRTSVRLLNVVLRDSDGAVVASAPKVEVGLSGPALLIGQIRAERVSLVGAEVSVRIEPDGRLAIFTGGDTRPIAVAPAGPGHPASPASTPQPAPDATAEPDLYRKGADGFAAALAWIDSLSRTGLDGRDLSEIGLKSGTLIVEDQREKASWTFENIDVSLNRPKRGGVQFNMESGDPGKRWSINASVTPSGNDRRSVRLDATRVPARDLLLALRFADLPVKADLPLSVRLRAELGPDGNPNVVHAGIVAGAGVISGDGNAEPIRLERASLNLEWNAAQRTLVMPLQMALGGNRFTLVGQMEVPAKPQDLWRVQLGGGSIVLDSNSRSPLVLSRIRVNARADPVRRQIHIDDGELGNVETGIAFSGGLDYSETPRLKLGLAAGRMSLRTLQRLWPTFMAPDVRRWVVEHVSQGTVERVDIAVNAPIEVLGSVGPPIPDDGLSIALLTSGTTLRPIGELPPIQEAELDVRTTGRTATVRLRQGTLTMPSGRKLALSEGAFRIPDTHEHPPKSRTHLRIQGPVPAAAELLAMERLRAASRAPLNPATSRGNVNARVTLDIPVVKDLSKVNVGYALDVEFTNFAAERMIMGHRVEAASLRLRGDHFGYAVKGDVKIAGAPASLDYRVNKSQGDDEVRLQGVLDEATRGVFGLDLAPALTGPVPIKLTGRIGVNDKDGRFAVEADLTQARIDELLPGLEKPPAKPARATFTLTTKGSNTRIDDLVYDGSGSIVRGNVVIDGSGNVVSANFPVYSLSGGDKVSLKVDRGSDRSLHATLRGDVLDGRPFIKALMAGRPVDAKSDKSKTKDIDLDVKVGAVAGHHGEALRGLDLKFSRRGGRVRSFTVKAKLGRNATLSGDLRVARSGGPALFVTADDAGALFRFTDTYSKIAGGRMTVVMDAPTSDPSPQHGRMTIENFAVRGEAALDRVVAGTLDGRTTGVEFSAMQVDFTRAPGQMSIREGVVRGPVIGATIDGAIDYRTNRVRMRGTLVPLYGVNNMFGQLPIVGMFLGGSKEGLVGITYEVVGPVGAPVMRVNPISAVAPGFIRKFFEFPSAGAGVGPNSPPAAVEPTR